jgi:hypothetical protein
MKTTVLFIAVLATCSFSLDKYTIPYAASDTMSKAQFNSNHDTAKAYIDKIIDTVNANVPRFTYSATTHDKVMPYLRLDTIRGNPDIDSISGAPYIDSISGNVHLDSVRGNPYIDSLEPVYLNDPNDTDFSAYCSLYDATTYRDRVLAYFQIHNKTVSIFIGSMNEIISGGAVYIRSAGNIPAAHTSTGAPQAVIACVLQGAGSDKNIGYVLPFNGYLELLNSSYGYLTAGYGGLFQTGITYFIP